MLIGKDDLANSRWWQLETICHFVGKADKTRTWRWYRDHAENGHWLYIERKHCDYNVIEDPRLPGFENFLRNLKYGFLAEEREKRVQRYVDLMNNWYVIPHWDYDRESFVSSKSANPGNTTTI